MTTVNKRSPVWEYFDINSDNNKFAVCLLCGIQISRGGEGKKAGTSSLKNHLKMKHPDKFHAINKGNIVGEPNRIYEPIASTSSFSASVDNKLFWDVNNTKAKKYNNLIAEMIALDFELYSIVERPGFSRLLKQVLPRYKMPSCETLSQTIIPDIYVRIFAKLKQKILDALAISVTSDVSTYFDDNSSFLRLTAHWLTSDFKLEHGVLAIKPIRGPHTGENIATELNTIADSWGINQSKIHLLIHDSDANIVKDFRVAECDFTRCFIHLLQGVVTESINIQPEVTEMLTSSRRLVTHLASLSCGREKMLEIQTELNSPKHQLVQEITTRWNSSYYMVESLLEQKQALSLYLANHDTLTLTSQQWCVMEQFVKLLKPFEEITKITSSDFSCISEVIPHVAALKKYLDKDETEQRTPDLPHMRASLKTELESRFAFVSQDSNYLIATFLDPRFKANYLGVIEADRARLKILSEHIKMSSKEMSTSKISCGPTPAKRIRGDETESNMTRESRDTFWDCFNEVAKENSKDRGTERNAISKEIDYYLNTVRIDRSLDPYIWWSANSAQYPNLAKFARIYLSAPCTCVYSEKLLSENSQVYRDRRRMPLDAEKLLFIQYNLPLVNYDY